jgi:hypothetical protein
LLDGVGAGIDDLTVKAANLTIERTIGTTTTTLLNNVDYVLAYDGNSKIIKVFPLEGTWSNGIYTITLANGDTGIKDLANNQLQPNEFPPNQTPVTQFVIQLTDTIVSPWQNPNNRFDVNANGTVGSLDLVLIINRILAGLTGPLPVVATVPPFIDVSGDGALGVIDALQLINHILSLSAAPSALTAGPAAATAPPANGATVPSASPSNSVAVGLAMSQQVTPAASHGDTSPAPPADSTDTIAATSVAATSPPMEEPHAGELAATMDADELDAMNHDLDSILSDLTGDLRTRVAV